MEHHFNTEIAKEYGMLEAVIIDHFSFWIAKNKANDNNLYDGAYWTYCTIKGLSELFIYATERKIRYAINHLVTVGIIQTGNYNKLKYDRTMWYAFTEKGIDLLKKYSIDLSIAIDKDVNSILQNCQMELTDMSNRNDENVKPIPYTITDTLKDTKKENIKEKPQKRFTPPTVEEVKNYCIDRNNKIDAERFVDYYASKGWIVGKSKMKDWKAAVRTWEKNNFDNDAKPKQETELTPQQQEIIDMWSNL